MEWRPGDMIKVENAIRRVEKINGVLCAVSDDHEGKHYSTLEEYLAFVKHCELIPSKLKERA